MLTEERHSIILDTLNKRKRAELGELCELLNTSESTVRRDLNLLDERGMLVKVRGGAIAIDDEFFAAEPDVEEKAKLFAAEKEAIARYAALLIEDEDFVYIDAGTTTEKMIDFIPSIRHFCDKCIHKREKACAEGIQSTYYRGRGKGIHGGYYRVGGS